MTHCHFVPFVGSWDVDDCLQIQEDVDNFESFDPKKVR
jgi:hypothetical protein